MDPTGMNWRAQPVFELLIAPLPLARFTVAVPVHLGFRAVIQEVLRFLAGRHLRATLSSIACERIVGGFRTSLAV